MACNIGVANFVRTWCSTRQWSDLPVGDIMAIIILWTTNSTMRWLNSEIKYGYAITAFANIQLFPFFLQMWDCFATFQIGVFVIIQGDDAKVFWLRVQKLFTWCNLWPKFVFTWSLLVDLHQGNMYAIR